MIAKIKYTNTSNISNVLSLKNDIGDFLVIDLEAMQGITLNYGKDYETIKNDETNADNYEDVYIINENRRNYESFSFFRHTWFIILCE